MTTLREMDIMKTEQDITKLGWEVERSSNNPPRSITPPMYRAAQGGFKTLWRPTPEQVLGDIRKMKQARETSKAPF